MKSLFTLLLCFGLLHVAQAQTGIYVPQMHKTDSLVKAFMQAWNVPGATLAITKDGRLIYNRAFGYVGSGTTETTKPHTLMRIASNSKAITGIAIMKLVEGGQLSLNDTVFGTNRILNQSYYLSAITDARIYNITVKQLLEHTAGWNRDIGCDGYSHCDPIGFPLHVSTAMGEGNPVGDTTLIKFLLTKGLNFTPGAAYNYSNIGYLVLAEVIEKKTGMSYADYVASVINTPLGLCDIRLGKNLLADRQEREARYVATPTTASCYGTGQQVPWQYGGWNLEATHAHGGFIATSADYVKMILAVDGFSTFPDILTPASVTTMSTGSSANAGYAKGWSVNTSGHRWHTGSFDGTSAFMCRTSTGYTWALHLNTRSNSSAYWNALDALPWNCIAQMTGIPAHNFFPPTQQASGLTATKTGATTADLSWAPGNGDKRLVLATEAAQLSSFPVEGSAYSANAAYGAGTDLGGGTFAVYYGAGNSVSVTGLDPTKTYRFAVVEAFENSATGNNAVYKHGCRADATLNMPTAVAGISSNAKPTLYPNPAGDVVVLADVAPALRGTSAVVLNATGQTLQTVVLRSGETRVDVRALPAGLYLLKLATGEALRFAKR